MENIHLTYKTLLLFRFLLKKHPNLSTKEIMILLGDRNTPHRNKGDIVRDIAIPYTLNFFGITEEEWNSKLKKDHIVQGAKFLAFALSARKVLGDMTLMNIGSLIRNKKNDGIIYYRDKMGNDIGTYKDIRDSYLRYEKGLKESISLFKVQDVKKKPAPMSLGGVELSGILEYISKYYGNEHFSLNELHIVLVTKEDHNINYTPLRTRLIRMVRDGVLTKEDHPGIGTKRKRVLYRWLGHNPYKSN